MVSVILIIITIIGIAFANKSKFLLKYLFHLSHNFLFTARLSASEVNMAIQCLKPSKSVDLFRVTCRVFKRRSLLQLNF